VSLLTLVHSPDENLYHVVNTHDGVVLGSFGVIWDALDFVQDQERRELQKQIDPQHFPEDRPGPGFMSARESAIDEQAAMSDLYDGDRW
jgi:hypothetical protein